MATLPKSVVGQDLRLNQLSPSRQRLLKLMQLLQFGTIYSLPLLGGEPVVAPPPRIVRKIKNGGANAPRPQVDAPDFALKREVVEFFADLDTRGTGTILKIEVAHGLPIHHEVEDVIVV